MPPTAGKNWLLRIEDATSTYQTLAAQRGGSIQLTADQIDITSKDEAGWRGVLPGVRSWSIQADGLIVESDVAFQRLVDAFEGDIELTAKIVRPDTKEFEGDCYLTEFPHEFPYDAAATYTATLSGNGQPTKFWDP